MHILTRGCFSNVLKIKHSVESFGGLFKLGNTLTTNVVFIELPQSSLKVVL